MTPQYWVHGGGGEPEGPWDLPALMRKARAGKLTAGTPVSAGRDDAPAPAASFPDVAALLQEIPAPLPVSAAPSADSRLARALSNGWRFVATQPIVFVLASLMVVSCLGFALLLGRALPGWGVLAADLGGYFLLQPIFTAIVFGLYRGQPLDARFFRGRISPVLGTLALTGLATGAAGITGAVALGFPGVAALAAFSFAPFIIVDYRCTIWEALKASATLAFRGGWQGFAAVFALAGLHFASLMLILPLPLALPILAVALAEIYDEMGH